MANDEVTRAEIGQYAHFEDGALLGIWLAEEVKPQLRKWSKSGDQRVRLLAVTIHGFVEGRIVEQDWPMLCELKRAWEAARDEKTDAE